MRIGFDAKRAFCNRTGLGNYSRGVIEGVFDFGPDVEIYLFTPKKELNTLDSLLGYDRVHLIEPSCWNPLWRNWTLSHTLKKYPLDIYHGLSHELPIGIDTKRVKTIVTMHDLIYLRFPHLFPWIDRKIYDYKFRYSTERADLVVAITKQTAEDLVELFNVDPKKIRIIYQSCSDLFFKIWPHNKLAEVRQSYQLPEKFLLYVGTIEERKNSLLILKAMRLLRDRSIPVPPLVIIGKAKAYKKQLEEYISQYHLEKYVFFKENIPTNDLPGIYQLAEIFIYPSFYEGFGLPIVEALASQVPVITTKGGCFPEAGGPATLYIDPHSEEELSQAMIQLLGDSTLVNKMKLVGSEYAKEFTLVNSIDRLWNCYLELLT